MMRSMITGAKEEGKLEGRIEGIEEGIMKEKLANAREMLLKNMDENLIMEITKLPLEQIQKLKGKIDGEVH